MTKTDADALFYFLTDSLLPSALAADKVIFFNARISSALCGFSRDGLWLLQQHFRPDALQLLQAGFKLATQEEIVNAGVVDRVFVLGTKQLEETRAFIAQAALSLKTGGQLVCAAALDSGGKRLESMLSALGFETETFSKYHARIVLAKKPAVFNEALALNWRQQGAMQKAGDFITCPGLFSWDRPDAGSRLLLDNLPDMLAGRGADLGCGWGFLARHVLDRYPDIKSLFCGDADFRAVEACRLNLSTHADKARVQWIDLFSESADLADLDWVIMNPPFHHGKTRIEELGLAFIKAARHFLKPGGQLHMVANAHLPYEKALQESFARVNETFKSQSYKVLSAIK